jgi:ribosomal-protein-alanine N-acetyltransferase
VSTSRQPFLEHAAVAGERVSLRPVVSSDSSAIFPLIHRQGEVLKWLVWDGPDSVAELEEGYQVWNKANPDGDSYHWAICDLAGNRVVGTISARFLGHPFVGDMGYWLAEEHWGRGFVTEAIRLLCFVCFQHLETRSMTAEVFLGNDGSSKVLERNAFVREETTHGRLLQDGQRRQAHLHTLTSRGYRRAWGDYAPASMDIRKASDSGGDKQRADRNWS